MYFFTHLFISKVLYQHLKEITELDQLAFAYGNIKPDLPSHKRNHHTLENCLPIVCSKSDLLQTETVSVRHFSVTLGVICHYLCDFFCYYHLNEEIHNKKLDHFLYELRQHRELYRIRYKQRYKILSESIYYNQNISSIIFELRKEYLSQPMNMKRDIDYAISIAVRACEVIISRMKNSSEITNEAEVTINSLISIEGGHL